MDNCFTYSIMLLTIMYYKWCLVNAFVVVVVVLLSFVFNLSTV